jgi:hypothetical protein
MRQSADANGITSIAQSPWPLPICGMAVTKVRTVIAATFGDWAGTIYLYSPLGMPFLPLQQYEILQERHRYSIIL